MTGISRIFESKIAEPYRNILVGFTVFALIALLFSFSGQLQAAKSIQEIHDKTGFVLRGTHITTNCSNCHVQGVFKGTPKTCNGCHTNGARVNTTRKTTNHIKSSDRCGDCHTQTAWKPATMNHREVTGSCSTCHNGVIATGKIKNHVESDNTCENCHSSNGWTPAGFNHTNVSTGTCNSCHATGNQGSTKKMNTGHVPTAVQCDSCHNTQTFTGGNMNHSGFAANCKSCHGSNNINATKLSKDHIAVDASQECDLCHKGFTTFTGGKVDHANFARNCNSCHAVGSVGATTKPNPGHIPDKRECDVCHSVDTFPGAKMNHTGLAGNCKTCHGSNNVKATKLSQDHIAVDASQECDLCHKSFTTFAGGKVDHANFAGNCLSCHAVGNVGAKTKPNAGHIPDKRECDVCHSVDAFPGAKMNHTGLAGNCKSCHNGTFATGVNSAHIAIDASQECDLCHTGFTTFSGGKVDHANFSGNCISCHGVGNTGASIKLTDKANHVKDARECDVCHNVTKFSPATMNHAGVSNSCVTCHDGTIAKGTSPTHIPILTPKKCEACHSSFDSFTPATTVDHDQVTGACASCHGGSGPAKTSKPNDHIAIKSPEQCDACHVYPKWKPATNVNHNEIVGSCSTCHDGSGVLAKTAKSSKHMPTSNTCENCHNTAPSKWTPAKSPMFHNDTIVRSTPCIDCHTTAFATNKPTNHVNTVPSNQACDDCHTTNAWKPATYDHQNVGNTRCDSCHQSNGSATAPGTRHFIFAGLTSPGTGLDCRVCHTTTTLWLPVTYNNHAEPKFHPHSGVSCLDCHRDNNAKITWLNPDPRTANQCGGCHTSDYEKELDDHGNAPVTTNPDCASSTCHDANGNIIETSPEHDLRDF